MTAFGCLLILPLMTMVLETSAYKSYMVVCPRSVRPGMDYSCKINLLKLFPRLSVTVTIESDQANFEMSEKFSIMKGAHETLITLALPLNLTSSNDYRLSILATNSKGAVQIKDSTSLQVTDKRMSIFIQTDKAIYKPGQLVQFRVFVTDSSLAVLKVPLDIDIFDPSGNKILQRRDVQGTFGVYKDQLQLSSLTPLGEWKITVKVLDKVSEEKMFTVDEFVLPKFEVSISIPEFGVMKDKYLAGSISAKYTFGKAVEGFGVLLIKKKFHGFRELPREYKQKFEINGEYSFQIDHKQLFDQLGVESTFSTTLVLLANVTELLTDKTLSADEEEIQYYTVGEKLSFLDGADNFKPGLKYTAYVLLSDQTGKPLGRDAYVNIKVTFSKSLRRPFNPFMRGPVELEDTSSNENVLNSVVKVPKNGIATVTFDIPNDATSVTILAEYEKLSATKYLQKFESASGTYIQVALKSTKRTPKAGRKTNFLIRSTKQRIEFTYLIICRGRIIVCEKQFMARRTYTLSIMMTSDMAPTSRLIVYYVRRDAEIIADSISFNVDGIFENKVNIGFSKRSSKPGKPVSLIVNADPKSQCSVLTVDKSVLLLKTGNDITTETVEDELSQYDSVKPPWTCDPFTPCLRGFLPYPIPGTDVSSIFRESGLVVMTDASLFQSKPYPVPRPFEPVIMEDNIAFDAAMPPMAMMKGEGEARSSSSSPRLRRIFPETWLFSDKIANKDGKCIIDTITPDTITTWVATAFAVNEKTGLGVSPRAANLRTFLNFFVRLELPYSVIRNEQVVLQAIVFNFYDVDLKVNVVLKRSSDFQAIMVVQEKNGKSTLRYSKRKVRRTVLVPAGGGVTINFPIRPVNIGNIDVIVQATSARAGDAVKRQLLVKAEGIPEGYNIPFLVQVRKWQNFSAEQSIAYPSDVVKGSESIRISAIGDLMGPTLNGLTKLLQMPYGCGEQNMITFVPNIYVINYLGATGKIQDDIKAKARGFMLTGYQTQLTFQRHDGSFSAFGINDPSGSTWLTAFVVKSFAQAKPYIIIDGLIMRRAIQWILDRADVEAGVFDEPGRVIHTEMQGGSSSGKSLTAFTLIALIEASSKGFGSGDPIKLLQVINSVTQSLENDISNVTSTYELCILSYALAVAGSDRVDDVLALLDERATYNGGQVYWEINEDPSNSDLLWKPPYIQARSRSIEATAYVLLTYAVNEDTVGGLGILKWLVRQRNENGGFGSTQDTVIALQALSEFAKLVFTAKFNLVIDVLVDPIGFGYTFIVNNENALQYQVIEIPKPSGDKIVMIRASGNGMALVDIAVNYNVAEKPVKPSFWLSASTNGSLSRFDLTVCFRFLGGDRNSKSSMTVLEIGLLSGFGPDKFTITDLGILKRVEEEPTALVLYLDEVTRNRECVSMVMERQGFVYGVQPASISMYDYYEPEKQASILYQPEFLSNSTFCDIGDKNLGCKT